jgi:hypothetical protein|tara:strand:- start:258 stop:572 length:315 start_codon:yes stop_codon:yes gene_type:complete
MKAICVNTKIITLVEEVSPEESIAMIALADAVGIKLTITNSCKILIFKCDTLDEPLHLLAEMGLAEYIGAMKEVTDWEMVEDNYSAEVIDFTGGSNDSKETSKS